MEPGLCTTGGESWYLFGAWTELIIEVPIAFQALNQQGQRHPSMLSTNRSAEPHHVYSIRTYIHTRRQGEREKKKGNLNHMLVADKNKTPRGNPLWLKACCCWRMVGGSCRWGLTAPHHLTSPTTNTHTPRLLCFAASTSTPELSKATEPTWINADDLSGVTPGRPVAPGPQQNPTPSPVQYLGRGRCHQNG